MYKKVEQLDSAILGAKGSTVTRLSVEVLQDEVFAAMQGASRGRG
jgi:hypothetical protein